VRLTILLGAVSLLLLAAAPAQARLVYVKDPGSERPRVYVAEDDGTKPRQIGTGHSPTVSADGRWVAWVAAGTPERVLLRRADRSRKARQVSRSSSVARLAFSPDSTQLGMVLTGRLSVHDIPTRTTFNAATGNIRGFSFSPDSKSVVYGTSGRNDAADAESDLYAVEFDAGPRWRITRDRKSLNPLWGPAGIVHDRQKVRAGDAPSYNLFDVQPDGGSLRRITALRIPSRLSGLVPMELSADGSRLLAQFVGEDTGVGFAVNPRTGNTRSLSREVDNGFLGFDLSADGRTVLGHTGGPEPIGRHDVVTVPWGGGEPTVLVRRAAFPDWSL
jgi:Tol biopolymer transport system component